MATSTPTLVALLATLVAANPAEAQPAPAHLAYAVYSHGFRVAELRADITLAPASYAVRLSYRLAGMAGLFSSGDSVTTVDGRLDGDTPAPREMHSVSHARGRTRTTRLAWRNGNPVTTELDPPLGAERDPVPAAAQAGAVDTLSALAGLLHQVAATGRCDAARKTFDGRRLYAVTARTVGNEALDATGRSTFSGPALRCDFQVRQTGGFAWDSDPATRGDPQPGTAWFAPLQPGEPPVPVRITFASPTLGTGTVYVTAAE